MSSKLTAMLAFLQCPDCGRQDLTATGQTRGVMTDVLVCGGRHRFPVMQDVPILIHTDQLMQFLNAEERACFGDVPVGPRKIDDTASFGLLVKEYENWSMQWNAYTYVNTAWEDPATFAAHIPLSAYPGRALGNVLEIGCGNGRNLRHVREAGDVVFGVDISESAYRAHVRTAALDNVFVVRSDAMRLPFRDGTFTTIFSDHVLQHIPDLEACFRELRRLATAEHRCLFNLYSYENNILMTHGIEPLKRAALNRLDVRTLDTLASIPAALLYLGIQLGYRPLRNVSNSLYHCLPLADHMTFWFDFAFCVVKSDERGRTEHTVGIQG